MICTDNPTFMRVACFDQKSFSNEGHHPLGSQVFREKHQQFQVSGCWFVARLSGGCYCHLHSFLSFLSTNNLYLDCPHISFASGSPNSHFLSKSLQETSILKISEMRMRMKSRSDAQRCSCTGRCPPGTGAPRLHEQQTAPQSASHNSLTCSWMSLPALLSRLVLPILIFVFVSCIS